MGRIIVSIADDVEEELRALMRRKGDLSRFAERAFKAQIKVEKQEAKA